MENKKKLKMVLRFVALKKVDKEIYRKIKTSVLNFSSLNCVLDIPWPHHVWLCSLSLQK